LQSRFDLHLSAVTSASKACRDWWRPASRGPDALISRDQRDFSSSSQTTLERSERRQSEAGFALAALAHPCAPRHVRILLQTKLGHATFLPGSNPPRLNERQIARRIVMLSSGSRTNTKRRRHLMRDFQRKRGIRDITRGLQARRSERTASSLRRRPCVFMSALPWVQAAASWARRERVSFRHRPMKPNKTRPMQLMEPPPPPPEAAGPALTLPLASTVTVTGSAL
jgi:hypothetical protein